MKKIIFSQKNEQIHFISIEKSSFIILRIVFFRLRRLRISKSQNSKLRIWGHILKIQYILNFGATIVLKTITWGFLRSLKTGVNLDLEITDLICRPYIRFLVKIKRFLSGKLENCYSSIWEITTNLITNLHSEIKNPILRSHTWCFDRIHIILYSLVWKILEGFFYISLVINHFFNDSSRNLLIYTFSMIISGWCSFWPACDIR